QTAKAPAANAKVAAPPAKAAPAAVPAEPAPVVPGPRIANARPIRVDPLEARDTTREIAREARQAEAPVDTRNVIAPEPAASAPAKSAQAAAPKTAEPAPARSDAAPADGDIVAARFAVSREWLASAPETTHTIQLMGISNDAQLKAYL